MKKLSILAAMAMASFIVVAISSLAWGAPAYGSAEWYLNYMQQYSGSPSTPSQPQTPSLPKPNPIPTPTPTPEPKPAPQPNPSPAPTYPSNSGQNPNWYLDYLNQYQNIRPIAPIPTNPHPIPDPKPNPTPPVTKPTDLSSEEQQLLDYINRERSEAGVDPVVLDPELVRVARIRATKLVETGTYEHNIPGLGTAGQHLTKEGYKYSLVGENLAAAGSVYQAHANLIRSNGHKSILLDPRYTKVGVGIGRYSGNKSGVAVIEIFAR